MGKTLGKMHSAAVIYNSKQFLYKRESALENVLSTAKRVINDKKEEKFLNKFKALVKKLDLLPKYSRDYSLIQYDFHCKISMFIMGI